MTAGRDIALVLGSGGARGLAHIGAIRCLEAHDYKISYIAGASIGALIGGIYGAGKLDAYAEWVCELSRRDVLKLLDISFSHGAIFNAGRVISVLKDMVGDRDIEDLDIGFTAVATEINEKREIWLNRGPLFEAIQASIAMPLIFAPVERDDLILVDGGLINPVPIAPTLKAGTAKIFAVSLDGPAEKLNTEEDESEEESSGRSDIRARIDRFIDELIPRKLRDDSGPPTAVELALQSIDTMQSTIGRIKLAVYSPDLTIAMPANLSTFLEFHRGKELIDFGYRRTEEALRRADLIAD